MRFSPKLVDLIRQEIKRQGQTAIINVAASPRPDHVYVLGDLDLYALAKAVSDDGPQD